MAKPLIIMGIVILGLKDCIIAEHKDTLQICQLKEEQRIKEWNH